MHGNIPRRSIPGFLPAFIALCFAGAVVTWSVMHCVRPSWHQNLASDSAFHPSGGQDNSTGRPNGAPQSALLSPLPDSDAATTPTLDLRGRSPLPAPAAAAAAPPPRPFASDFGLDTLAGEQLAALTPPEVERLLADTEREPWERAWFPQYLRGEAEEAGNAGAPHRAATQAFYYHALSRELVHRLASPEGYLFVTFANHHYTWFALTWVAHLRALRLPHYLVGALDDGILLQLAERGINTYNMAGGLSHGDFGWNSPVFARAQRKKIVLLERILGFGVKVIITDIDAMWVRDPIPFFERFPEADVLTSTDEVATSVGAKEQLEENHGVNGPLNVGLVLFRNASLPLVHEWVQIIEHNFTVWEQDVFRWLVARGAKVAPPPETNRYYKGYDATLTVGVLPVALFCAGHVYFTQDLPATLGVQPYAVHATYQYSGTPGKRHRFRERLLWVDPAEYFSSDAPGGFLTFTPDIPPALLNASGPRTGRADIANVLGHFELVNYQLKQLRSAFALATILNRTLILPQLWCGVDRFWGPHTGTLPGSHFQLPFMCPADHILDLENGATANMAEAEFGPHIPFREYSFLQNMRLPDRVRASTATVAICADANATACSGGTAAASVQQGGQISLAANLNSEAIKMALSGVQNVSILNYTTMHGAFANFTAADDWARFARRMSRYGAPWCCIESHPGHIFYDLLADVPGHTDMHGRTWGVWVPTPGP